MSRTVLKMILLCFFICQTATVLADSKRGMEHKRDGYAPGRLLVQLEKQAAVLVADTLSTQDNGLVKTGLTTLDELNRLHQVQRIVKVYNRPKNRVLFEQLGCNRWYVFNVPEDADINLLASMYSQNKHVQAAKPDWMLYRTVVPNDPVYALQWAHNNTSQMLDYCWNCGGHDSGSPVGTPGFDVDAQSAWDQSQKYGDINVIIAIIDSGVDLSHPDLNLVKGYDFGDNDANPNDDSDNPGHGTACAGIAAALADNNTGVAGIAGGCSIMPLKIANQEGTMYLSSLAEALYYAADNGAHIASMSLGAYLSNDSLVDPALQYAYEAGVTLFAAAGNDNKNILLYPANTPLVIAVGAASPCGDRKRSSSDSWEVNDGVDTDPNGYTCDGERWWGSNFGSNVQDEDDALDFLAPTILPTTDIMSLEGYDEGDYYKWFNGSSCATPYAAGVAALIKSQNYSWTPAQIYTRIANTATDIQNIESEAGWDRYSGYGMVNAGAALSGNENMPPVAEANGPYSGKVGMAIVFSSAGSEDPDGQIESYWWSFGDGSSSELANPSHTYSVGGNYTVSLTVTDEDGLDTKDTTTAIVEDSEAYISEESENNDRVSTADGPVGLGIGVSGKISRRDCDWFYFDVANTGTLDIVLDIIKGQGSGRSDLDWILYDESLNYLASGYTSNNPETGSFDVDKAGRYYIQVDGYRRAMAPYRLTVNTRQTGGGSGSESQK